MTFPKMYWAPSSAMFPCMADPVLCKINQGMLILVKTNVQLYSGVKTQKHPSMTCKGAKKPAI